MYVLLDGVGDLPHPDLNGKTPLQAASTPNMDKIARNGCMGEVISVGEGIAPESDIAVFNMLGYKFRHADYVGRGVIEAIGIGTDFKDGDLALRGNFATLDENGVITDRRAGRNIEKKDALAVAKELEEKIKLSEQGFSGQMLVVIQDRLRWLCNICFNICKSWRICWKHVSSSTLEHCNFVNNTSCNRKRD